MSLEDTVIDFVAGTIAKTLFSPITTPMRVIEVVIDMPEEDRISTFLSNEPGVDIFPWGWIRK